MKNYFIQLLLFRNADDLIRSNDEVDETYLAFNDDHISNDIDGTKDDDINDEDNSLDKKNKTIRKNKNKKKRKAKIKTLNIRTKK